MRRVAHQAARSFVLAAFLAALLACALLGRARLGEALERVLAIGPLATERHLEPGEPRRVAAPREPALLPPNVARRVPVGEVAPVVASLAAAESPVSPIDDLQRRLAELGTRNARLEQFNRGKRFRFSCEVPLGDGSAYTRRFEDVGVDRERVIARVVRQAEEWAARRMAASQTTGRLR